MQARLDGRYAGVEGLGDFGVAAAFLHEREKRAVLRAELRERVTERVEFLGVHRAGRFRDVFVLVAEGEKDAAEFLAAQLVDAGVAREAEEPRFELRGRLETIERADHLDKNLLRQVLHVIAAVRHGVNKAGDAVLVGHDEIALRALVALLGAANEVGELGRRSWFHASCIVCEQQDGTKARKIQAEARRLPSRQPSPRLGVRPKTMKKSMTLLSAAALGLAVWGAAGCSSHTVPLDPMAEGLTAGEKPVAMKGEGSFLGGKLAATATVSRGFDRGVRGGARGASAGGKRDERGGRGSYGSRDDDRGSSGMTDIYNISGGDSEEEQKEAMAEYMRQALARRAAGSPMPPVTLRVKLENRGTEPIEVEVTEVNSELGNFAVRPPKLTIAPGQTGELDPMISQLGVTSDEIPLKVVVRAAGKTETQTIAIKNLILPALRK